MQKPTTALLVAVLSFSSSLACSKKVEEGRSNAGAWSPAAAASAQGSSSAASASAASSSVAAPSPAPSPSRSSAPIAYASMSAVGSSAPPPLASSAPARPPANPRETDNLAERTLEMSEAMAAAVGQVASNCDQSAAALMHFFQRYERDLLRLKADGERLGEVDQAQLEKRFGARVQAVDIVMTPVLQRCKSNAQFQAALAALPK